MNFLTVSSGTDKKTQADPVPFWGKSRTQHLAVPLASSIVHTYDQQCCLIWICHTEKIGSVCARDSGTGTKHSKHENCLKSWCSLESNMLQTTWLFQLYPGFSWMFPHPLETVTSWPSVHLAASVFLLLQRWSFLVHLLNCPAFLFL